MQRDVPTVLIHEVFHVGTMRPEYRRPVTSHGDGLSVGLDPVAWSRRLRATHASTWRITRRDGAPLRFADIDSFTEQTRRGIVDWAIDCGYIHEIPVWLVEKPEVVRRWPLTSSTSEDSAPVDADALLDQIDEHLPADITDRPADPTLAVEPPSAAEDVETALDGAALVEASEEDAVSDHIEHTNPVAAAAPVTSEAELRARRPVRRSEPTPARNPRTAQRPERMVRWPLPDDLSLLDAHHRAEREGGRLVVDTRLRVTDTFPEARVMRHRDPILYALLAFIRTVRPDLDGAWWGSRLGWLPQGSLMLPVESTYLAGPGLTEVSLGQ